MIASSGIRGMLGRSLLLVGIMLAVAGVVTAESGQNRGAAEMLLNGGSRGDVPFPHLRHQSAMADCLVCHDRFPQEKGAIDMLKASGVLPKREVMDKLCIKCHRAQKTAGQPGGPITCSECHKRD